MEMTMVPSQFLSVVLEEDGDTGQGADVRNNYIHHPSWQNHYEARSNNISDQEMWNLTKNLPKALLAECTVEISRTPINQTEKPRKLCFDARVSPVYKKRQSQLMPPPPPPPLMRINSGPVSAQYLPPPPQLLHRSEWIEESMDVQDLLTGVEAVYSDNDSDGEYSEEAASVSIFPITVPKTEKVKPEKVVKKQDLSKFSYPCEHCPNVYSNRGALWQHSVATHSVEKTCECKICGRKFYRNCSLALHLKSHSEEEYCQCKECGKSFNRLANLERHMRIHVDAETFPCPHCDKVFRDKTNLLRHAVSHTLPKMFQCDVCNKSYKSQDHLDVHFQTTHAQAETSLTCSTCGDVFSSFAELMQHDATHSSQQAFLCKLCGSSFNDKTALKKHMMSHSGERLACSFCGIDFTQKSSLLRHIKRMHPQDSDGLIDPSLYLDDNNSGLESHEGSECGSWNDTEQEEESTSESNSTVELRKALGSPIKAGVFNIIDQQKIINNNISGFQNHTLVSKSSIGNQANTEKNLVKNGVSSTGNCTTIEVIHEKKSDIIVKDITNGTVKEPNDKSVKDSLNVSEENVSKDSIDISEVSQSASGELKQQIKSDISDPLSSVDINTMHTTPVKLET